MLILFYNEDWRRDKACDGVEHDDDWETTASSICINRWQNARPNAGKFIMMNRMFDESGLFLASCRHGFILTFCDMIKSGEWIKKKDSVPHPKEHYSSPQLLD